MAKEVDETASIPEIIDDMREATERFFEVAFKVVEDLKVDVREDRNRMTEDFETLAKRLTRKRMRFYGYSDEEIDQAEASGPHTDKCTYFGLGEWQCDGGDGKSYHPVIDELYDTAEWVRWMLDEGGLFDSIEKFEALP